MKLNCWEYKGCGYGPNGDKVEEKGPCPAACNSVLDGVHDGYRGGRACWIFTGTYCGGTTQGAFVKKYSSCMHCDFYRKVMEEEGAVFQITLLLMKRLKAA